MIAKDVTGHDKADLQTQKTYNQNSYNIRGSDRGGRAHRGRGMRTRGDSRDNFRGGRGSDYSHNRGYGGRGEHNGRRLISRGRTDN